MKLNLKHRKILHYTLLACVIALQIVIVVIWVNEKDNETEISNSFDAISATQKITKRANDLNNLLIQSQEDFNNYVTNKDEASLIKYGTSLSEISTSIDSLSTITDNNQEFKKIFVEKTKVTTDILALKLSIDSIIGKQGSSHDEDFAKLFKFKTFEFKTILDNVKTESTITSDSLYKKGLISRLGSAIAGESEVQREQINTVVTMKFKDEVTSGNVGDQIKRVFLVTNKYYEDLFEKLKISFSKLRNKELELLKLNSQLLLISKDIVPNYTKSANLLQARNQEHLREQYKLAQADRNYIIIVLFALMLLISIILFGFTRSEFEYEKKLTKAQDVIRKSLNFKNRIIGMISHEIRSPLNIISIYSKKMSTSVTDPEVKETFKSIQFTTNSLLLLANQVLEFSKDENHKLELKNKKFFIKEEVSQIIASMTSLAKDKGNKINFTSNLSSESEVYSDASKIHQLFYNVVGNANKFTNDGIIDITANLEPISEFEMNFKVAVKDNGVGIVKSDLENVFKSYYQGTVSGKVTNLGVGLGLNLCKEIVELFDGEIRVESQENKGTIVAFNLILATV